MFNEFSIPNQKHILILHGQKLVVENHGKDAIESFRNVGLKKHWSKNAVDRLKFERNQYDSLHEACLRKNMNQLKLLGGEKVEDDRLQLFVWWDVE